MNHAVTNQSTPYVDVDLYASNRPLRDALARLAPALDTTRLQALGVEAGSAAVQAHARQANACAPRLHTHDAQGRRVDEVEFHPGYHALLGGALRHGLHGAPWAAGPGAHVERAAGFMLWTEAEAAVLCPVSMSYAVLPALRANPALHAAFAPGLASTAYDPRCILAAAKTALTCGMGMTEKQGGSDVRANTTRAQFAETDPWGRRYRLTGHKWFMSAPMSDAFLVLAQTDAGPGCFLLPRWLPEGGRNAVAIQRLKCKLGNGANASAEVEFDRASAWLVGDEGRGIAQILAMGAMTRLDCALGTAGQMRQALSLAMHHTAERHAFGKPLIAQPLMRQVLADLALESEAATALAMRLAAAVDRGEHPGPHDTVHESGLRRLLTSLAKFWVCKRGAAFAQEAMECLGGNGYIEARGGLDTGAGVMARIYRDMPLNSIWEGAGNVIAIDLLRALRAPDVVAALDHEIAAVRGADAGFDRAAAGVQQRVAAGVDEAQARRLARDLAVLLQAALLHAQSPAAVFDGYCRARLGAGAGDAFGMLPEGVDIDAIVERARPAAPTGVGSTVSPVSPVSPVSGTSHASQETA